MKKYNNDSTNLVGHPATVGPGGRLIKMRIIEHMFSGAQVAPIFFFRLPSTMVSKANCEQRSPDKPLPDHLSI